MENMNMKKSFMMYSTIESKKSNGFWDKNKLRKAFFYPIKLCNKHIPEFENTFFILSDTVVSVQCIHIYIYEKFNVYMYIH